MASKPTQRTLKALRALEAQGVICQVVEQWKSFGRKGTPLGKTPDGVRVDLFGFIDILAVYPDGKGIVGIQCTSGSNTASRLSKIKGACREKALAWLLAGGKIEVWGWRHVKKQGLNSKGQPLKGKTWQPKILTITLADFEEEETNDK